MVCGPLDPQSVQSPVGLQPETLLASSAALTSNFEFPSFPLQTPIHRSSPPMVASRTFSSSHLLFVFVSCPVRPVFPSSFRRLLPVSAVQAPLTLPSSLSARHELQLPVQLSVHPIPARKSTPLLAPHLPVLPRAIRPIPLSASLVRATADPSKNMTSPHLNFAPNHLDKSTTCSTPLPFRLHVSFYLPRHSRPVAYISSVVLSFGSLAETHWLPSHLRGLLITKPTALLRHRNFLPRAAPSSTHQA